MAKKPQAQPPENHERWLVSYADFITLLFAFFVMLYANSKTDQKKAQQISESFQEAMSQGIIRQTVKQMMGGSDAKRPATAAAAQPPPPPAAEPGKKTSGNSDLQTSMAQLRELLKTEIQAGRVAVELRRRGLVVSLRQAAFFPSGNDNIDPATLPTLSVIAEQLKRVNNPVRMEGHTDAVPIHNDRFADNWYLSSARAIAVLNLFVNKYGVPRDRVTVAGFADTAPVAGNTDAEGRAHNRRVDIVVLNEDAQLGEPERAASTPAAPSSAAQPQAPATAAR